MNGPVDINFYLWEIYIKTWMFYWLMLYEQVKLNAHADVPPPPICLFTKTRETLQPLKRKSAPTPSISAHLSSSNSHFHPLWWNPWNNSQALPYLYHYLSCLRHWCMMLRCFAKNDQGNLYRGKLTITYYMYRGVPGTGKTWENIGWFNPDVKPSFPL